MRFGVLTLQYYCNCFISSISRSITFLIYIYIIYIYIIYIYRSTSADLHLQIYICRSTYLQFQEKKTSVTHPGDSGVSVREIVEWARNTGPGTLSDSRILKESCAMIPKSISLRAELVQTSPVKVSLILLVIIMLVPRHLT